MQIKWAVLIFFLIITLANFASAISIILPAVTKDEVGLTTTLNVGITAGNGRVFMATSPLISTNTQKSARDAVDAAEIYLKEDLSRYDVLFSIDSVATQVDGPSAGAAMALGVIAEMQKRNIPSSVSLTGTINKEGEIGYVGGVFEKALAAHEIGVSLFIIPKGEAMQTALVEETHEVTPGQYTTTPVSKEVDLREYGPKNWNMIIVEASTIKDVVQYAFATDINTVVISEEDDYPEFDANPLPLTPRLEGFKTFVINFLQRCQTNVSNANSALAQTTITDQSVIKIIGSEIGRAQDMIDQANTLIDKNYLYTAANYAFLASNSANLAKEILEHPSAIIAGSEYYKELKNQNRANLNLTMASLSNIKITRNNVDWIVSAKQRALWAKAELDALDFIVSVQSTEEVSGLDNLRSVISAQEWISTADEMIEIAKTKGGDVLDISNLKYLSNNKTIELEDLISTTTISADNQELFSRYFNSAKEANTNGWYLTSIYSSAVAKGIIESQQITDRIVSSTVDTTQLLSVLESDLKNMEGSVESAPAQFAELFWQHANYYKDAAIYHKEHQKSDKAESELSTGILLMFTSKKLTDYSNEAYSQIIFTEEIIEEETGRILIKSTPSLIETLLAITVILGILAITSITLIKTKSHFTKELQAIEEPAPQYPANRDVSLDIKTYEIALKHAREDYHNKKISKIKYDKLSTAYENKLKELRKERR
ncbi:MAG: hypothetical protein JXA43_03055 [Candidatus Diapherotrites archaeon]|nr:hypothetical protein [Candidatus Diapherotrites archaeon]